jgi:hypothetical protein
VKAETWLPFVTDHRALRTLVNPNPPKDEVNQVTISGGWDGRFLYITLSSRQSFRGRLEFGANVFRLDDSGLHYGSGPQVGESAPGAVIASRESAGGFVLRAVLPLKLVLPAGMEDAGPEAEPVIRLRAVAELASGTEVCLPEQKVGLAVRLARPGGSE